MYKILNNCDCRKSEEVSVEGGSSSSAAADSSTSPSSSATPTTHTQYSTLWFIGLVFNVTGDSTVNLDLTEPIQSFTDRGNLLIRPQTTLRLISQMSSLSTSSKIKHSTAFARCKIREKVNLSLLITYPSVLIVCISPD